MEREYASKDLIPAGLEYLYRENGDKWVLITSAQIERNDSVVRLENSIQMERNDHKETKAKLAKFTALGNIETVQANLDRIPELEAAAAGKIDETKLNELADARARTKTAPLERRITELEKAAADDKVVIEGHVKANNSRLIKDHIRESAKKAEVTDGGISDALMYESSFEITEDNRIVTRPDLPGITPGVDATVWLTEMQAEKTHWWPGSEGAGSRGSAGGLPGGGTNPFSKDHWNLTEQGALIKQDVLKAEGMAKAAGTTIGGQPPAK